MKLVVNMTDKRSKAEKASAKQKKASEHAAMAAEHAKSMEAAIAMMSNIVEVACEQEQNITLMRLVNLMDLYRAYLQLSCEANPVSQEHAAETGGSLNSVVVQNFAGTGVTSFERFVRDSRLLELTAKAVSLETGHLVMPPAPISLSANS